MKSILVCVRLKQTEHAMLMKLRETARTTSSGEFLRLLIWREWNRRRGLEAPKPADYQADFRTGRPKETV